MVEWLKNGVLLGWLIDGDRETIYVYRPGAPKPEILHGAKTIEADGPLAGFKLDLEEIWQGL